MNEGADGLTEQELSTWMPFVAVLDLLPSSLNADLQRVVGQPLLNIYVLGHLLHEPSRQARLSALAACMNAALPRMSRIVARLEASGLVERSTPASDGRAVDVALTADGEDLLRVALPLHDRLVREAVFDVLSPLQLAQLREIAEVLITRLHPDMASPVDRQRRPAVA